MSEVFKKAVEKALSSTVVKIYYKNKNQKCCKFFTRSEEYVRDIFSSNEEEIEAFNFITKTKEGINLSSIDHIEYDHGEKLSFDIRDSILYESNKNKKYYDDIYNISSPEELKLLNENLPNHTDLEKLTNLYTLVIMAKRELLAANDMIGGLFKNKIFLDSNINFYKKKLMLVLDIQKESYLDDLEYCKSKMKKIISKRIIKEKKNIDKEFESIYKEDEGSREEVDEIKNYLDSILLDENLFAEAKTVEDLLLKCWPPILAPNPFTSFIHEG